MIVPVFIVVLNLWMTARRKGELIYQDPAGLFVMTGVIWYIITCIQGPVQALPTMQRVTHFNNWTVGHAHIAMLGFAGFIALGAMWHILPLASNRRLWSQRLVTLQYVLVLFGITGFFLVLTAAGLVQGGAWSQGLMIIRELPARFPYMVARAVLGLFILTGSVIGLYNFLMTLRKGEQIPYEEGILEPIE